jgi:hypothetical protein
MNEKIAVVVLADVDGFEALGRVANALELAKECALSGTPLKLIFDGAGTKWVAALSSTEHRLHALFKSIPRSDQSACAFCATAFGVKVEVERCGVRLLAEFDEHPSLLGLIRQSYQIVTF